MTDNPAVRGSRPADPVFRLYVDESGDHSYSKLDDPWHRHLCLLGIWLRRRDTYSELVDGLTAIKRDIFGMDDDDPLVFHLADIKGRRGPFGLLRDSGRDARFGERLLALVERLDFTMVSAIVDKHEHHTRYADPIHPYHFAMTAIVERYVLWLSEHRTCGDAIAESRGKKEDRDLGAVFRSVATAGTAYVGATACARTLTSRDLKLKKKEHNIAGLQLADLLAHPIRRAELISRGLCPNRGGFAREVASVAAKKYRSHRDGATLGFGRVWLPGAKRPN